ncbi:beta subunit of N-acylethanolamine-hydrolyzing acid amidase-domain-containing protein [Ilyonectria destructans]|nr:beta subunit of N-acylethanolamine-hydrolyzing acid amidase-domain-containing protein [Ilyonectria destructans]
MRRDLQIPKFVINLSQPPEARYAHIIPHFREQVDSCDLPGLFYDLLRQLAGQRLGKCLGVISRLALRRLFMAEESAELVGISKASGIPMHILVAFNVILDLLLGCTSGGARTLDPGNSAPNLPTRMLHFRTLDWGMDQLRKIIVELDFVRSHGGPVVATTVTYLGYVGVLTGVRKGLSMSLNFRPSHARNSWRQRASFRWQQALVVLGFRQSISSVLRGLLLEPPSAKKGGESKSGKRITRSEKDVEEVHDDYIQAILSNLSTSPSTAAYLIFCRPDKIFIVQKDHHHASIRVSDTFLTAYNHDADDEIDSEQPQHVQSTDSESGIGMADILNLSLERKCTLDEMWAEQVQACQQLYQRQEEAVTLDDVKLFLNDEDISNEETHYAVIMDPTVGKVLWRRAYEVDDDDYSCSDGSDDDGDN